ncbi:hypothetical protein [Dactylosporangium sp. NPDC049140]
MTGAFASAGVSLLSFPQAVREGITIDIPMAIAASLRGVLRRTFKLIIS